MSPSSTSPGALRLRFALAVAWIIALYFLCNPYRGVRHDAILYFGQMQMHLTPGALSGDMFFLSNSQDGYSIYSMLFAPILQALGMSSAEIVILLVLHALFLCATWQLTAGMPPAARWSALALAIVLPHYYANGHRFAYAEPFLTARSLAEPFAIFALANLLRGRLALALLAAMVAAFSHPLIALPAWLVGWRLLCARDRRWNWAALVALPVAVLAWMGVGPLGGLAHVYDATWLTTVKLANSSVFVANWQIADWQQVIFDVGLVWLCARDRSSALGRLAWPTLVVAIGCLLASAIGVDVMHNVMLTQLQLWRATWIAHLVAMLSLGPLLLRLWQQGGKGRLAVFAVLLGAITVSSSLHTAWVAGIVAFAAVALAESKIVVGAAVLRIGIAACTAAAVLISSVVAASEYQQLVTASDTGILIGHVAAIPSTLTALVLVVALLGLWPMLRPGGLALSCSTVAAALLLAAGVAQWDQRNDWASYVEQQGAPHPFQALIPPGASVYWPDDLLATWALLKRPSFYNPPQMSGALFSRETSVAGMANRNIVDPLVVQSKLCMSIVASGMTTATLADCRPTDVAVHDVCHLKNAHPDFIVLNSPIQAPPLASWHHPSLDDSEPADHFLYECSKIP